MYLLPSDCIIGAISGSKYLALSLMKYTSWLLIHINPLFQVNERIYFTLPPAWNVGHVQGTRGHARRRSDMMRNKAADILAMFC